MCEALGKCGACIFDAECKHGHMGTGDPICSDFECASPAEICDKYTSCIAYNEEYEMYGYYY